MVLGVNHANVAAQKVYERVGFVKVPRTLMGRAGEQYIYTLDLDMMALQFAQPTFAHKQAVQAYCQAY